MSSSSIRSLIVLNYAQIICGLRKVLIATLKFSGLWLARHGWRSLNHQNQSYTAVLFIHELEDFFLPETNVAYGLSESTFFLCDQQVYCFLWMIRGFQLSWMYCPSRGMLFRAFFSIFLGYSQNYPIVSINLRDIFWGYVSC